MTAQQRNYWANWTRLRNAVYVTYPYAKAASRIMNEINALLTHVTDRKERRKIIHSREKELKQQFTDKLTNLSVYQGRVLMKLINRETGNNCYEIIHEYKGFVNAAFWQTVAVIFGSNLKQAYDPSDKDAEMEKIVKDVAKMYGYPG
jgi:phosphatidate phosphatase APP1